MEEAIGCLLVLALIIFAIYLVVQVIVYVLIIIYYALTFLGANIVALADKTFGTWGNFSPVIQWAIAGFIVGTVSWFALVESPKLNRPSARPALITTVLLVLCTAFFSHLNSGVNWRPPVSPSRTDTASTLPQSQSSPPLVVDIRSQPSGPIPESTPYRFSPPTTVVLTPTPRPANRQPPDSSTFSSNNPPFRAAQPQTTFLGERYPNTRLRLLSNEEVSRMSPVAIRYAINEMYARHGADFRDRGVKADFQHFSWYNPTPGKSYDAIEAEFSDVEKENVKLLGMFRNSIKKEPSANTTLFPTPSPRRVPQRQPSQPNKAIDDRTRGLDNL